MAIRINQLPKDAIATAALNGPPPRLFHHLSLHCDIVPATGGTFRTQIPFCRHHQDSVRAVTMSQSVLVTGGAGYIGSHACKALAQVGYIPVTYDNLSRGHRHAVKWGPLVEGDVGDGVAVA